MDKLIRGLLHYRKNELPKRREMFAQLAKGQDPDTLFLACADSRVVPNLLASQEPGDLFTIRTVGNLIAPAGSDGAAIGDVSEAAAVEYALLALRVSDIVVCGHSHCGAMKAAYEKKSVPGAKNLDAWLQHAVPSVDRALAARHIDHSLPMVEQLSQVNVLQQIDHLRTYGVVREREERGDLRLHAWWFDVGTGETHVFDSAHGGFVMLDDEVAERIAKHSVPAPRLSFEAVAPKSP